MIYNIQHNIGRAKYVVNYYDGFKTHKDGSKFFDIAIFRNKPSLRAFVSQLNASGYKDCQ
jgi:hypothetical protein